MSLVTDAIMMIAPRFQDTPWCAPGVWQRRLLFFTCVVLGVCVCARACECVCLF
jgi:hypothetical protein